MKENRNTTVANQLESLIANGKILHPASVGIAKVIIAGKALEQLSPDQRDVFQKHIFPVLDPHCGGCSANIGIDQFEDAFLSEDEEGDLFCHGCLVFRRGMRKKD